MEWIFQGYIFTFTLGSILVVSIALLAWYKLSARGWAISRLGPFDLGAITHELLFENIGDGVVVLDKRNCLVSFNPAAQRYFKLSAQLQGHEFKLTLSGEDHVLSLALDTEAYQQVELVRPGPPPVYLDARIFPLYRSNQRLIGRVIVTRDITTPRQFENALYLLNTELESLVKQRTAQLQNIVYNLEKEVNERRQAEASLRSLQENMAQRIADQSRKMAALYEVIMLYGQLLETDELVEQCLGEINAVVEASSVGLYQWSDEARQLRLTAHWELSAAVRRCLEILPSGWLPETKTPKMIPELSRSEPALAGLELYLGTPIHLRTQVIGVLALFWAEPKTFSAEDLALFNILADQLGLILENDRLREIGREAAALHERQRLARELHDSVTQSLHSLTLLADTAVYVLPQQNQSDWSRCCTNWPPALVRRSKRCVCCFTTSNQPPTLKNWLSY
ncbi:MAG: GAF domain-containing protein [Anaerolineales bacterium]|nr:GAF domain-containing protein [Anaerolineales bacterium]